MLSDFFARDMSSLVDYLFTNNSNEYIQKHILQICNQLIFYASRNNTTINLLGTYVLKAFKSILIKSVIKSLFIERKWSKQNNNQ